MRPSAKDQDRASGGPRTAVTRNSSALGVARLDTIWIPGITLFLVAAILRILVAARRDGIEVDGITYLRNAQSLWSDWDSLNVLHPPL
jgi:hypothetical protein